jgi:hypothetical protein
MLEGLEAARASGMMPLEFLLVTMRNPVVRLNQRIACAIQAAPYCHQKLALLTIDDRRTPPDVGELDERLVDLVAELLRRRGVGAQIEDHRDLGSTGAGAEIIDAEVIDHDEGPSE